MGGMKKRVWSIAGLVALVLVGLLPGGAFAQTLTATAQVQIQPNPIPLNSSTGSPYVGVIQIDLSCTGATAYIGRVVIRPRAADSLGLGWADATNTHLFLNSQSPLKYRAMNLPTANEGPIGTLTVTPDTPSPGDLTIDIGEAATIAAGASRTLWVAFSYPASLVASTPKAVNCYATSVSYGSTLGGNKATPLTPPVPTSRTVQIIDYHTTFVAEGLVDDPPLTIDQYDQGNINVQVAKLTFGSATLDEDLAGVSTTKQLSTIQLRYLGERTADVAANSTSLYLDDGDGGWDAGDTYVASNVFSGSTLTFGPFVADPKIQFAQGPKTYLVVVNIDTNAVIGNHIGFDIANPSTSIAFANVPAGTLGSAVSGSYNQKGYITDTAATPTTLSTFTVSEYVPPDTTPPEVSVNFPTGAAVALASDVTIVFSENMDEDTLPPVTPGNVTFTIDGGAAVAIDAPVYNDITNTLTLHPTGGLLAFSTTYRVTVKGGAGGAADEGLPTPNVMASDFTWTFTTVAPTPPTVASTVPAAGDGGASRTDDIEVTFSEPVWGFTTGDFTLTGPSGAVASAVTFSNGSQTATISHATLTFGATYTATIGTGITDSEGTAMAAPYVWSFAVASAIAPKVTAVFPTDASVGVSRTATIRATFSKAIDDSTIEGTVGTPSTTFLVYTDTNRNGAWDAGIDTAVSGRGGLRGLDADGDVHPRVGPAVRRVRRASDHRHRGRERHPPCRGIPVELLHHPRRGRTDCGEQQDRAGRERAGGHLHPAADRERRGQGDGPGLHGNRQEGGNPGQRGELLRAPGPAAPASGTA